MDRPKTYTDRKEPFSLYKKRGEKRLVSGTGMIFKVEFDKKCDGYHRKYCNECQKSSEDRKPLAQIWVRTAAHVVYDNSEAEMMTCHLSYGGLENPIRLTRFRVSDGFLSANGSSTDYREICYETHDMDLAKKVQELVNHYDEIVNKAEDKYGRDFSNSLVILVSHPHGQNKMVSLGDKYEMNSLWELEQTETGFQEYYGSFRYNAPTCPGSSGASFCILGFRDKELYQGAFNTCHSGTTINRTINQSSLDDRMLDNAWPLRKEAKATGIKPKVYEPVASWYSKIRSRIGYWDLYELRELLKKIKKLKAQMTSEITYDDLVHKIPSENSETRDQAKTLARKWGQKLHQLCQYMEYCLERLLTLRDKEDFGPTETEEYLTCLKYFLKFDKEHTGQLDYVSLTCYLTSLGKYLWSTDKERLDSHFAVLVDSLEQNRSRRVSLAEITDRLVQFMLRQSDKETQAENLADDEIDVNIPSHQEKIDN